MTALADRLRCLRLELAQLDGLVRAHPQSTKAWARLVAGMAEDVNVLEAMLSGAHE